MSWEQLLEIKKTNITNAEIEASTPRTDCPEDGWPLDDAGTVLHCQYCGETYKK